MKAQAGGALGRLAGAPISWGVCEEPGWGIMLPRERVLSEMRELGLKASELGALGYLGDKPDEIRSLLDEYSLGSVGGFVPLSLHDPEHRQQAEADARQAARLLAGSGGTYFVTAIVVDAAWSTPFEPTPQQWDEVASELAMVAKICGDCGLAQVVHPHVGTLVERTEHIEAVMERSDTLWCLDTGHMAIGGADLVLFATDHARQVGLVHLKDVDLSIAHEVRAHTTTLLDATKSGLFRALGQGDVDVAAVVTALEAQGYDGWYVLEQDTTISEEEAAAVDPAHDVQTSIDYLARALAGS